MFRLAHDRAAKISDQTVRRILDGEKVGFGVLLQLAVGLNLSADRVFAMAGLFNEIDVPRIAVDEAPEIESLANAIASLSPDEIALIKKLVDEMVAQRNK